MSDLDDFMFVSRYSSTSDSLINWYGRSLIIGVTGKKECDINVFYHLLFLLQDGVLERGKVLFPRYENLIDMTEESEDRILAMMKKRTR